MRVRTFIFYFLFPFIAWPSSLLAQTRFYFPDTTTASVSPAFTTSWTETSQADFRRMVTSRVNSPMTNKTITALPSSVPEYILSRQYISDPIAGGSIAGTVKGQFRCSEFPASLDATLAVLIKVVSHNGDTLRGTLLALSASDEKSSPPEFSISLENRRLMDVTENTSLTLTPVVAQPQDRIVVELGVREASNIITRTASINFGDNSSTDLGENENENAANNPWIEFSPAIVPATLSVAVSNSSFAFGTQLLNTWLPPDSSRLTNDGNVTETLRGKISTFTAGANTWTLSSTANGADQIRAQWSTTSASGPWNDISAYNTDFTIVTGLVPSSSVTFYFRIQTPTSTSSFNPYSSTLTVTAQ